MRLGRPGNRRTTLIIRSVLGGLALVFVIAFGKEIIGILTLKSIGYAVPVLCFNCFIGFGLVFVIWLILISSQALLPVNNLQDIYRTAWRLWLYITRSHGPAVFIKDGVMVATHEDERRRGHGVVVVDFNSAVVLEDRDVPLGLSRLATASEQSFLNMLGLNDPPETPRARGSGIVFTRPNERIRGVVDLRPQFRKQMKVTSYTREGIELKANIFTIFTIGDDPNADALQVTPISHRQRPEDWRVCVFTPSKQGDEFLHLTTLSDELDSADREEIAQYASMYAGPELQPYIPLPEASKTPRFNAERVFSAVFAQARGTDQEVIPWTELPTRVAAGFYRDLLPKINYDELYDLKGSGSFPLLAHKRKLRLFMRNNGVLAYRVIHHGSREPLRIGSDYRKSELLVSPVRLLTNPKLLRDRGIRILFASFGDPIPVSDLIYQQRLDSWKATWEQELDVTQANRDLQAMRIRTKAMVDAQQDLWYSLNQLFKVSDYSDEALALRLIQSLETASADPKTRQLLPGNTIDLLRYVHSTLLGTQTPSKISQPPTTRV